MDAPPESDHKPRTSWVVINISLDVDDRVIEYTIEGKPDGGPLHIHVNPEYTGAPIATLHAVGVDVVLKLEDVSLKIVTDPETDEPPVLRIVE